MADILFLEPFYGGSHKYFADGLIKHSRHNIKLLTLPGRFWKWRMESAALAFYDKISSKQISKPDFLIATNLMDLTQFKGLTGWHDILFILYVHENQLDYPLSPGEKRDFHYVWKDYLNFLTADKLIFNSWYNLESFLTKFRDFTSRLPDNKPADPSENLRSKTEIITPGCNLINRADQISYQKPHAADSHSDTATLLWNQRWEHDKNPEAFFTFLKTLKKENISFKLIILGESYKDSPLCFKDAREDFKDELIQYGFAESREEYEAWLAKADFVISTAMQENFGISIVEAMSAGAIPLLPARLAYPEVLAQEFHSSCLYNDDKDMLLKFTRLLALSRDDRKNLCSDISKSVRKYSWSAVSDHFDKYFESLEK